MTSLIPLLLTMAQAPAPAPPAPGPKLDVKTVVAEVQKRYDAAGDFRARFTQTLTNPGLGRKTNSAGEVMFKKPGRMRWDYTAPEKKEFVSDGRRIYSYIPADKQVILSTVPPDDEATTAVLFLAGKGNLTRDFKVSYAEGGGADTWTLRLDPKQKQREYDWLVLQVDRASLQIRGLTAADQEGGRSTFTFTNYRENAGIADSVFVFKIPKGTDVITAGPGR